MGGDHDVNAVATGPFVGQNLAPQDPFTALHQAWCLTSAAGRHTGGDFVTAMSARIDDAKVDRFGWRGTWITVGIPGADGRR